MTQPTRAHMTSIHLAKATPAQVDAGAEIALKVRVSCPHGCDLRGKPVRILAQDGSEIEEIELATFQEAVNETDEFLVKVPNQIGKCAWSVVFPAQEDGEVTHETSSVPVTFDIKPHTTYITAWDIPLPAVAGSPFEIKVGVKCSAECHLTGSEVRVVDDSGALVASGTLGGAPWPQTTGLYWAAVTLTAPAAEQVFAWNCRFPAAELELPHQEASTVMHFRTAPKPEHVVTVRVTDRATKAPVDMADVMVGAYRALTDRVGVAQVGAPKGTHELYVACRDYEMHKSTVEVAGDVTVDVELALNTF